MDTNQHLSDFYIKQNGYDVTFDGNIIIHNYNKLIDFIERGIPSNNLYVSEMTPEIVKYNSLCSNNQKITVKDQIQFPEIQWNIPQSFLDVDIKELLINLLQEDIKLINQPSPMQINKIARFEEELTLFEQRNMLTILKVIYYVITTFKEHNIVWGIGRGSCVSSYILYLLEVHDVDPVLFDLDLSDFFN